jgi:hypothetical protein
MSEAKSETTSKVGEQKPGRVQRLVVYLINEPMFWRLLIFGTVSTYITNHLYNKAEFLVESQITDGLIKFYRYGSALTQETFGQLNIRIFPLAMMLTEYLTNTVTMHIGRCLLWNLLV